jgi:signal transduction histidine kinase
MPPSAVPANGLSGPGGLVGWDELPDGVVVADDAARIVVFNCAAERITGIQAVDVLGKNIRDALPFETLDGQRWWVCTDPYGGLATRTRQPEQALLLPGAREVLVTATYARDRKPGGGAGPLVRLVLGLRDTAARVRQEQSQAELVTTVAHELRSPLTSVKGFTATLLAKWSRFTDEQKRLMLETVNADADRVTRLITELLDISRIDAGRVGVRRQIVDLASVVNRVVEAHIAAGEPAERFVRPYTDHLPEMWLDADKTEQIIGNLIENAVRHGAGKVTVTVEREMVGNSPGAVVTVMDEGDGIPAEVAGRVFTKFWRSGKRGGTGLGLYIVRGLVEAQGGTISVARAPSGGAMFRFVLPAGTPELVAELGRDA